MQINKSLKCLEYQNSNNLSICEDSKIMNSNCNCGTLTLDPDYGVCVNKIIIPFCLKNLLTKVNCWCE